MTHAEAAEFIAALRAGRAFATRFQEEEWGLRARPDGRFDKWSHRLLMEGGDERSDEILSEAELEALLVKWYSLPRMKAGLR